MVPGNSAPSLSVPTQLPILMGEGFGIRDVHALSHFVGFTGNDLIGSHIIGGLWTQDGIQLAFNVYITPPPPNKSMQQLTPVAERFSHACHPHDQLYPASTPQSSFLQRTQY